MPAVSLSPDPILQFLNNQGQPNAGGTVLTQVGGVNYPTYQDSAGTIALPNPIPLNSRGEISNAAGVSCQLFLVTGVTYVFTLYDPLGNQINQATYVATVATPAPEWLLQTATIAYISAASFTIAGNLTATFDVGRRVRTTNTGGTVYSSVLTSSYSGGTGLTTVTLTNDSGSLDTGLSAVYVGLLDPANTSLGFGSVQRYLGSVSGTQTITTGTVFTAASIGQEIQINGAAAATLPLSTTVSAGQCMSFRSMNASATVAAQGTDVLVVNGSTSSAAGSLALGAIGDWVVFMSNGAGSWFAIGINKAPVPFTYVGTSSTYATPYGTKVLHLKGVGPGGGGGGSGTAAGSVGGTPAGSTWGSMTLPAGAGGTVGAAGVGVGGASGGPPSGVLGTATQSGSSIAGEGPYYTAIAAAYEAGGAGAPNLFFASLIQPQGGQNGANAPFSGIGGNGGGSNATSNYHGGGGGASGASIETWIFNPAVSYVFTAPAGGTAGTAGTSGLAGGTGGPGAWWGEAWF